MKKEIIVGIVIIIALIGAGYYFLGNANLKLQNILVKTDIKTTDGNTLDISEGVYGTLSIEGKIVNSSGNGIDYIHFIWKADTEIPSDSVFGILSIDAFYQNPVSPDGSAEWKDAKGENHIWTMDVKFYKDNTIVENYIDDELIDSQQITGGYSTINGFIKTGDTRQQIHCSGAFTFQETSGGYEHANHIPTFYLIKDDTTGEYYFSHNAIYIEY